MQETGSLVSEGLESEVNFAMHYKPRCTSQPTSSDCLSQRLELGLYLNSFLLIVFMTGSPFLGADHIALTWVWLG